MIAMYAKCGEYETAIDIGQHQMNARNKYISTSLMDCYAKMGDIDQCLSLFYLLKQDGNIDIHDDYKIYCIVLNACSHSGIAGEAFSIFQEIQNAEYLHPHILTAMIDCFARCQHLNTAEHLYHKFKSVKWLNQKYKLNMLKSLISACKIYDDYDRANRLLSIYNQQ